ncbi:SH3 domain-containing protein [Leptolyngbya sp. PL-A3]|uniref:SH3 domain-containing protein n=1 Tax=Leptolyngbya sp. PL-A3 TaxID=2933911 RepID=UPI00329A67D1
MNWTALLAKTSLIGITFAVPWLSFASVAEASRCRTIAEDWDGSVDVRSEPQRNIFNIIATVPNGTDLDVRGRSDDWLEVYTPDYRFSAYYQTGWVRERATRRVCSRGDRSWNSRSSLPPLPPLSPDEEYDYDY